MECENVPIEGALAAWPRDHHGPTTDLSWTHHGFVTDLPQAIPDCPALQQSWTKAGGAWGQIGGLGH